MLNLHICNIASQWKSYTKRQNLFQLSGNRLQMSCSVYWVKERGERLLFSQNFLCLKKNRLMIKDLAPFPFKAKVAGWMLFIAGLILGTLFAFFNLVINFPVLAIFSSFLEEKYFTVFTTNVTDELTLLLILGGMFLVVFSKDHLEENSQESSEKLFEIRAKSMFKALYYNTILLFFSILFVFGQGFFWVMILNLLSVFVLYLVILAIKKRGTTKI